MGRSRRRRGFLGSEQESRSSPLFLSWSCPSGSEREKLWNVEWEVEVESKRKWL